ncbi:hypothetical protein ACGFZ9_51855 [Streptomyces mirabilis]
MRVHDGALALREAGHEVYTPGLPGIGERTHLTPEFRRNLSR